MPKVRRALDGLRQWPQALCIVAEDLGTVKRDWDKIGWSGDVRLIRVHMRNVQVDVIKCRYIECKLSVRSTNSDTHDAMYQG